MVEELNYSPPPDLMTAGFREQERKEGKVLENSREEKGREGV